MTAVAVDALTPDPATGRVLRRGLAMVRGQVALAPGRFAVAVAGSATFALLTLVQSWALGRVVDHAVLPSLRDGRARWGAVVAGVVLLLGVAVARSVAVVVRRTGAAWARSAIEAELRNRILDRLQALPLSWHRRRPPGELLAHAETDVVVAVDILNPLPFALGVVVLLVLTAAWLVSIDPVLSVIAFVLPPIVVVISHLLNERVEARWAEAQSHAGDVSAVADESFDGAALVKAHGAEDRETARFARHVDELREARVSAARTQASFNALLNALPDLGTVVALAVGAWRLERGALTAGQLVAVTSLFGLLSLPLRLMSFALASLPRSLAGWDRVQGVLHEPLPPPPARCTPLPSGPLDLDVRGLTVLHEGASVPALEGVRLQVPAGSTLALVGPTGSGKSTLLAALARLVPATAGTIRLGGVDLAEVAEDELAATIAIAFQEPFLFGRTVGANILLGMGGPGDEAEAAAHLAQAHDFVRRLPNGYDTVVGERGATLSGGQRQRVALARALARIPRVLLLDDATASVDPATEARITAGLRDRLGGTTTVVVATRLSTIGLADQVAYLERGQVLAVGAHEDLLEQQPGYRAVVEAYA